MTTPVSDLLAEIAELGRVNSGGYRRFAFTDVDRELGEWFAAAATARGATVTVDRCGNQWAWWGDPDAALARGVRPVVTGSHLDSVPDGGPLDGPLGVASALVAVDALAPDGDGLGGVPLGVVRFVDEEGARFGLACSGSRLLSGTNAASDVLSRRDAQGVSYAEALRASGTDPTHAGHDVETLRRIGVFVELHIEQGRGLATPELDAPVGVASGIRGHGRWRFDLPGRADHAGTTAMLERDDPMQTLALLITSARAAAIERGVVATVGKVLVEPNGVNAIPSLVRAWLDARGDDGDVVRALAAQIGASLGPGLGPVEESWTPTTHFDAALATRVASVVGEALGAGPAPVLATGAGHDAGVLAQAGVPSAMLFVRNPTGVSHSPAESAQTADLELGARALGAVLVDVAAHPGVIAAEAADRGEVR